MKIGNLVNGKVGTILGIVGTIASLAGGLIKAQVADAKMKQTISDEVAKQINK